jgi:nitrogen fixation NifU-like protein
VQQSPPEELDDLYRRVVLDHNRTPRNQAALADPDVEYEEYNPVCGDRVALQISLVNGVIRAVGFQGQGCAISQASASLMTESLKGLGLEEAEALSQAFRHLMGRGNTGDEKVESSELGDLEALQGVRKFPVRIKCALLAWVALEAGIEDYRSRDSST